MPVAAAVNSCRFSIGKALRFTRWICPSRQVAEPPTWSDGEGQRRIAGGTTRLSVRLLRCGLVDRGSGTLVRRRASFEGDLPGIETQRAPHSYDALSWIGQKRGGCAHKLRQTLLMSQRPHPVFLQVIVDPLPGIDWL
jgi:hypothetical protein